MASLIFRTGARGLRVFTITSSQWSETNLKRLGCLFDTLMHIHRHRALHLLARGDSLPAHSRSEAERRKNTIRKYRVVLPRGDVTRIFGPVSPSMRHAMPTCARVHFNFAIPPRDYRPAIRILVDALMISISIDPSRRRTRYGKGKVYA